MIFRLGGYAVESNMGHIGDVLDPRAGEDPTIYGCRRLAPPSRPRSVLVRLPAVRFLLGVLGVTKRP
jgi:hypothetical protein